MAINTGMDLTSLLDYLPDGVFALDTAGKIIYANARGAHCFKSSAANLRGKPFFAFVSTSDPIFRQFQVAVQYLQQTESVTFMGECYVDETVHFYAEFHARWVAEYEAILVVARKITPYAALQQGEDNADHLLRALPDLIFRMNGAGIFLDYYSEHEDLHKTPQRVIGQSIRTVHPTIAKAMLVHVRKTLKTHDPQTFEYTLRSSEKDEFRFYEARLIESGQNEVTGIVRDITDLKHTLAQLQNREYVLELISKTAAVAFRGPHWRPFIEELLREFGTVFHLSRLTLYQKHVLPEHMLLFSPEITWSLPDVLPITESYTVAEAQWETLLFAGDSFENQPRDLFYGNVHTATAPLLSYYFNSSGVKASAVARLHIRNEIWGYLAMDDTYSAREWLPYELDTLKIIAEFISAAIERELYEHTQLEIAAEQERIRALRQFISDISHDLKTPLTAIKINLFILRQSQLPAQEKPMRVLETQFGHLERLLEDLTDMARLDLVDEIIFEEVNVCNLLRELVEEYTALSVQKQNLLLFQCLTPPLIMTADGHYLRRALNNVIVNALNYTPPGGRITVSCEVRPPQVEIRVSDTGIGIATEEIPLIFRRFYRTDKARGTDKGRAGLGLSIAQRIVELHRGRIEVESELDKGSTFTLILPLDPTQSPVTPLSAYAN